MKRTALLLKEAKNSLRMIITAEIQSEMLFMKTSASQATKLTMMGAIYEQAMINHVLHVIGQQPVRCT